LSVKLLLAASLCQARVSSLCDEICWSVCLLVCLSAKCIVAKWLSGSGCCCDGECGQLRYGCIIWGLWSTKGKERFWGELGPSHCNQWGLCDVALPKLLWTVLVTTVVQYCIIRYL